MSLTANESGTGQIELLQGRKVVASGTGAITGNAKSALKATFTRKARTQLKRKKSVKLTLLIVLTDAAGNANAQTKAVTLKR